MNQQVNVNFDVLEQAEDILHTCLQKDCRRIISVVLDNPGIVACDIDKKIQLPQSTTAGHLGDLKRAGVLSTNRVKKYVHYSVNTEALSKVVNLSTSLVEVKKAAE